jgi:hypothetical protein
VNVSQAEPFSAVYLAPAPTQPSGVVFDLGDDRRPGPIFVMEGKGRVREVVRR